MISSITITWLHLHFVTHTHLLIPNEIWMFMELPDKEKALLWLCISSEPLARRRSQGVPVRACSVRCSLLRSQSPAPAQVCLLTATNNTQQTVNCSIKTVQVWKHFNKTVQFLFDTVWNVYFLQYKTTDLYAHIHINYIIHTYIHI